MSEEKKLENLAEDTLESVSGGMSVNLEAAYAVNRGYYGSGDACSANLARAGLNPGAVLALASDLAKYEDVAKAVVRGEYGKGQKRIDALTAAGYPADVVQNLVNNMCWDPKKNRYV